MIRKHFIYFLPILVLLLIYFYGVYQNHKLIDNPPLPASLFSECLANQINTIEASIGTKEEIDFFGGLVDVDDLKPILEIENLGLWIMFCQMLGQEHGQLKALWPSHTKPYEIINHDSYSLKHTKLADKVATQSIRYLAEQWDFEFSNTIYIVLTARLNEVAKLIPPEFPKKSIQNQINKNCDHNQVTGNAFTAVLLICLKKNEVGDSFYLPLIIAHEIFHAVQTELVGSSITQHVKINPIEQYGPFWMKEGCASAFAENYVIYNEFNKLKFHQNTHQISSTSDYLEYIDYKKGLYLHISDENYVFNTMALCNYLAETHGFNSIINFYRDIGGDEHWQDVFYRLFKIKHDDYLLSMGAISEIPQNN